MTKTLTILSLFAVSSVLIWSINSGHDVRTYMRLSETRLNRVILQILAADFATLTVFATALLLCLRNLRQRLFALPLYFLVSCSLTTFFLSDDSISSLGYFAKGAQAYQNRHFSLLAAAVASLLVSFLIARYLPNLFAFFCPAERNKKDKP